MFGGVFFEFDIRVGGIPKVTYFPEEKPSEELLKKISAKVFSLLAMVGGAQEGTKWIVGPLIENLGGFAYTFWLKKEGSHEPETKAIVLIAPERLSKVFLIKGEILLYELEEAARTFVKTRKFDKRWLEKLTNIVYHYAQTQERTGLGLTAHVKLDETAEKIGKAELLDEFYELLELPRIAYYPAQRNNPKWIFARLIDGTRTLREAMLLLHEDHEDIPFETMFEWVEEFIERQVIRKKQKA